MSACFLVRPGAARSDGLVTVLTEFGASATNHELVPAAIAALRELRLAGGTGILFNGPASLPVAMALAHEVAHLYGMVGCFDPKLQQYVVAISHSPAYRPGDLIPAAGNPE
jgi:CRISPR-associated protein Csx3